MIRQGIPTVAVLLVLGQFSTACTVSEDDDGVGGGASGSAGDSSGAGGSAGGSAGTDAGTGGAGGLAGGGSGGSANGGSGAMSTTVELIDCGSRDIGGATVIDSAIVDDQEWSGTVYIDGAIDVRAGATITIAPGTDIVVAVDGDLELGWNSNAATLLAEGTVEQPVRFCGEQGDPGYWKGLIVNRNVTSNSVLRNVLISDAGGADEALVLKTGILFDNVQVRNSGADGVLAEDFDKDSRQLSVEGVAGVPVIFSHASAIDHFPLGGVLDNNEDNTLHARFSEIEIETVFHDPGVPYVQESRMDVRTGGVVTFEAGVDYQFAADADLDVGWNSNDATILVDGTEAEPVIFRGVADQSGFWEGLRINTNVRTNSRLSHLEIHDAGGGGVNALYLRSAIVIDHVLLERNDTGVFIEAQGVDASSANLSITGTAGLPLTIEPDAWVTLPEGGTFTGNDTDEIGVQAGVYSQTGTVPNLGVPYRILGNIDTRDTNGPSSMTLVPGTHFVMSADSDIEFGWNSNESTIIAVGTAAAPIRFTGLDETASSWLGLTLRANVLSASKFDFVEIGHGAAACLTLYADIAVTNSNLFDCEGAGIRVESINAVDYATGNTFTGIGGLDVDTTL